MDDLKLSEIQQMKQELETTISTLLHQFKKETGLSVEKVNLYEQGQTEIIRVEVEINI